MHFVKFPEQFTDLHILIGEISCETDTSNRNTKHEVTGKGLKCRLLGVAFNLLPRASPTDDAKTARKLQNSN